MNKLPMAFAALFIFIAVPARAWPQATPRRQRRMNWSKKKKGPPLGGPESLREDYKYCCEIGPSAVGGTAGSASAVSAGSSGSGLSSAIFSTWSMYSTT